MIRRTPIIPMVGVNSPNNRGDIKRMNKGEKVIIGEILERSEYFNAFNTSIVVITTDIVAYPQASQKYFPNSGIPTINKRGNKNKKAKNLKAKEITYSLTCLRPLLLKKSLVESKKAAKKANIAQIMIQS